MKHFVISLFAALFAISPICSQNGEESDNLKNLKIQLDHQQLKNDKLIMQLYEENKKYKNLYLKYEELKTSYNELKNTASDINALERLQKELDRIENEIAKLKESNTELKQYNKTLKDSVRTLNKAIIAAKKEKKTTEDKLKKAEEELRYVKKCLEKEDSTTRVINQDSLRLEKISAELDSIRTENSNLGEDLAQLEKFKKKWLKELAQNADKEWLCKKYAEVDLKQLEQAYEQYKKYGTPDNPEVEAAKNKMTPFVESCRIYNEATEAINAPYDETLKETLLPQLYDLRDNEQDQGRKDELQNLARLLEDYESNVSMFKKLKADIDETINKAGKDAKHNIVYLKVKVVLDKHEKENNGTSTISTIKEIPYLKKRLEEYTKALQEDCVKCSKEFKLKLTK